MAQISGTAMVNLAASKPDNIVGFEGGAAEYIFFEGSGTGYFTLNGTKQPTATNGRLRRLSVLQPRRRGR